MIVTVTGGASSGKSETAENIAVKLGGRKGYFAAMKPYGKEGRLRVERHRAQRSGKGFATVELWRGFCAFQPGIFDTALIECVPNMLANMLFDEKINDWQAAVSRIETIAGSVKNTVIVTGDVFFEPNFYEGETAAYMEALGKINVRLARISDVVIESVAGIPVYLKGGPVL